MGMQSMISHYFANVTVHGLCCFVIFVKRGLLEIARSIVLAPLLSTKEIPHVTHVDTVHNKLILTKCPSLTSFQPLWWAVGAYAQTLALAFKPEPMSQYRREMFALGDGVEVALDWKEGPEMDAQTPLVVCLHGLGGDRNSRYLQVFTDVALNRGYRTVVYNRRGHGLVSLLPPNGLSYADTLVNDDLILFPRHNNMKDMLHVVDHINTVYPDAPKYMIGFSCGANLAINYLEHMGTDNPFIASCSISNGYDIWQGTTILRRRDPICDGVACQFLKDLLGQGRLKESKELAKAAGIDIDFDAVMRSKSLQELDKLLLVPAYGYPDIEEYYADDSCHTRINSVKSPLLCIGTKRDPLVDTTMLNIPITAAKMNANVITVVTEHGGHIGWLEDLETDPWYTRVYFEYIDAITKIDI
jgi:predicted alpha/beta-fold hydrolase